MSTDPTPTDPIATRATHLILRDDLASWLAEYGHQPRDVREATINLRPERGNVVGYLDITWYKRNPDGNLYRDGDEVATGQSSIPLHSWPPLTPAGAE